MTRWKSLNHDIAGCEKCPRLRDYCREVARVKRKSYRQCDYWGRPVPNFGERTAELLIVGLAPAAHGANRTGRMFTGDRSGEWLYRALHRAGLASQARAESIDDGLRLVRTAITAVCHCAPPDNKPSRDELAHCRPWLERTLDLCAARAYLALGQIAWLAVAAEFRKRGWISGRAPKFSHGAVVNLDHGGWLFGSYHPSQQNTFTGRLTEPMLDDVLARIRETALP